MKAKPLVCIMGAVLFLLLASSIAVSLGYETGQDICVSTVYAEGSVWCHGACNIVDAACYPIYADVHVLIGNTENNASSYSLFWETIRGDWEYLGTCHAQPHKCCAIEVFDLMQSIDNNVTLKISGDGGFYVESRVAIR